MAWDVVMIVGLVIMLGVAIFACRSVERAQVDENTAKAKATFKDIAIGCVFGLGIAIVIAGVVLRCLRYPQFFNF